MTILQVKLDDELSAALDQVCAGQGCDKESLATQLLRRYVNVEQLKRTLLDPGLAELYLELQEDNIE
jgi:predicted transcriptional regulator